MLNLANKNIFVSVGSRFAMNRLLECADQVLEKHPCAHATAQVGLSTYHPKYMQASQWADAAEFDHAVKACDVFISHAGMGNILLAAKYKKPIVIMPRGAERGEHINDHQIWTAKALAGRSYIRVADDATQMENALSEIIDSSTDTLFKDHGEDAKRQKLISTIRHFIDHGTV